MGMRVTKSQLCTSTLLDLLREQFAALCVIVEDDNPDKATVNYVKATQLIWDAITGEQMTVEEMYYIFLREFSKEELRNARGT